eukprot:scaffold3181_cov167-Amphora_coffeaeformis.AAC.17
MSPSLFASKCVFKGSMLLAILLVESALVSAQEVYVVSTYNDYEFPSDKEIIWDGVSPGPITEGVKEIIFEVAGPVAITDGVEFPVIRNGIWEIDVSEDMGTVQFELLSGATVDDFAPGGIVPAGRFDWYYISLPEAPAHAEIVDPTLGGVASAASVEPIEAGFALDFDDMLGTNVGNPMAFPTGGIRVQLGPGGDYNEEGQTFSISILSRSEFEALTEAPSEASIKSPSMSPVDSPFSSPVTPSPSPPSSAPAPYLTTTYTKTRESEGVVVGMHVDMVSSSTNVNENLQWELPYHIPIQQVCVCVCVRARRCNNNSSMTYCTEGSRLVFGVAIMMNSLTWRWPDLFSFPNKEFCIG